MNLSLYIYLSLLTYLLVVYESIYLLAIYESISSCLSIYLLTYLLAVYESIYVSICSLSIYLYLPSCVAHNDCTHGDGKETNSPGRHTWAEDT
jgi:hypothetical protein